MVAQDSLKRGLTEASGLSAQSRSRPGHLWADTVGTLLLISSDTLCLASATVVARLAAYMWLPPEDFSGQVVAQFSGAFILLSVALLGLTGAYRPSRARSFVGEWSHLASTVSLAYMALGLLVVLGDRPQTYAGYAFVNWAAALLLLSLGRLLVRHALTVLRQQGIGRKRVVLVGTSKSMQQLLRRLDRGGSTYRVVGMVNVDHGCNGRNDRGPACLSPHEGIDFLPRIIESQRPAQVLVAMPLWRYRDSMAELASLVPARLPIRLVPFTPPEGASIEAVECVDGVPVAEVKESTFSGEYESLKRVLDVALASAALVLALPLMALIAIAIKLDSPGPVLFRQVRVGRNRRAFCMYKFRSMRADAEALLDKLRPLNEAEGHIFKMRHDPRTTRVGRLIRRFSLDELPQLFNVLEGTMSLVGPRPPLPDEVKHYAPWQLRRLDATPGMTGLWQVKRDDSFRFEDMVRMDLEYIDNWSLALDIWVLLKTIPAIISSRGAC